MNLDVTLRLDVLPRRGETALAHHSSTTLGGKGANQAVASAALVPTHLIAQVGSDDVGKMLRDELDAAGVMTAHIEPAAGVTGAAYISLDASGDNSIVVDAGANHLLDATRVEQALTSIDPAIVCVQCEIDPAVVRAAYSWAKTHRKRFIFNASPVPPYVDDLLDTCDPLIVNRGEAIEILGKTLTTLHLADQLAARCRSVVVTDSAQGAVVSIDSATEVVPARTVSVVDTTGAGDAFAGHLAGRLARGQSLFRAVVSATSHAADIVQTSREDRVTRG